MTSRFKGKKYFGRVIPPYQDDPIYKLFKRDADRDRCGMWLDSEEKVMKLITHIMDKWQLEKYKKWRKD